MKPLIIKFIVNRVLEDFRLVRFEELYKYKVFKTKYTT